MNGLFLQMPKAVEGVWLSFLNLLSVWTIYQALIIAGCWGASLLVTRRLEPWLEARLRRIEQQPALLRFLVALLRRLHWALFALMLWTSAKVLREFTWPSNSYFVALSASLATSWTIVSILSRTIRKRSLAKIVEIAVWSVAALYIVGWLDATITSLDFVALSFGGVRISVLTVVKAIAVLGVLLWLGNVVGDVLEKNLKQSDLLSPSLQVLVGKLSKAVSVTIAVLIALSAAGIDVTILTVFSGAFGLGLGFGLQKLASNLASGIIMLTDRSVKPGDIIQVGTTFGWITSMRARYVSVVTRDGAEYLIPNEQFITERVVNWSYTDRNIRIEIKFGVAYDSDPHVVRKLVTDAISSIDRVLPDPPPICHLVGFGESSLDFVARFWICDPDEGVTNVRGQALLAVWDVFREHGIQIPYPHREVIVRGGEEGEMTSANAKLARLAGKSGAA
ncbi:MAG: mechanosensitive ion channel [Hyphomicrobiaceae bacterium]